MTVDDAEEEDFQDAIKEAVADKLGVDEDDVTVTAVTADGKDGVKVTYTVANLDDDAMDAAEKALESSSLASELNMKSRWYSIKNWVDRLTSTKSEYTRLMSSMPTSEPLRFWLHNDAMVII